MNYKLKKVLQFIIFLSIGLGLLYYIYHSQEVTYRTNCKEQGLSDCSFLQKLLNDFREVNYFWIGLVVLTYLISTLTRAILWKMLLSPLNNQVRLFNTFLAILVCYFANSIFPRAGEIIKCGIINRHEKIPIDQVIGTVVTERILDLITVILVFLFALFFQFEIISSQLSKGTWKVDNLIYIGLALVATLVIAWIFRKRIGEFVLIKKIKTLLKGLSEGMRTIFSLEKPWLVIGYMLITWLFYYLMVYFTFFAFVPTAHLSPLAGLVVFIFASLGFGIPSPGGIGTYQFLVMTALVTFYAFDKTTAFTFANIAFFVPYLSSLFFGLLAWLILPFVNPSLAKSIV